MQLAVSGGELQVFEEQRIVQKSHCVKDIKVELSIS